MYGIIPLWDILLFLTISKRREVGNVSKGKKRKKTTITDRISKLLHLTSTFVIIVKNIVMTFKLF